MASSSFVLKNLNTDQEYPLTETMYIGRSSDNKIVIDSAMVSRYHSRLYVSENKVFVKDLNSSNGTFVNGESIQDIEFLPSSQLQIGEERFTLLKGEPVIEGQKEWPALEPAFKGILIHPRFKKRIEGCVIQSVQDVSKKYAFPVNSIFTIGRLNLNDIFIDSDHVSRNHAKVDVREHGVFITDTNSTNGTFIDSDRINKKELNDGDIFSISGQYNFMISIYADDSNCLRTVKNVPDGCFIDVVKDCDMLLDLFREEFGEPTLLEVERQTVLFCNEFENVMKSTGQKTNRMKNVRLFLQLLSKADLVDIDVAVTQQLIGSVKKLSAKRDQYHVVYFEVPDKKHEEKVQSNGFLINETRESQLLLSGIPYENFIYMVYASDWLSQLSDSSS